MEKSYLSSPGWSSKFLAIVGPVVRREFNHTEDFDTLLGTLLQHGWHGGRIACLQNANHGYKAHLDPHPR